MLKRTVQHQADSNDSIMAVFVCERGSLCVLEADVVHATQSRRLLYRDLLPDPKITSVSGSGTHSPSRSAHKKSHSQRRDGHVWAASARCDILQLSASSTAPVFGFECNVFVPLEVSFSRVR